MNTIVLVTQGLNAVATFGPIAIGLALQIKKLFSGQTSGDPFEVQIMAYKDGILKTIDETDAIWAEWTANHPE